MIVRGILDLFYNEIMGRLFWVYQQVGSFSLWFTVPYITQNAVHLCADNDAMGIHLYLKIHL